MAYGRVSRRTESHEKSMGSYTLHAWRDAMAIAVLLDHEVGIAKARRIYESLSVEAISKYESEVTESVADFIQKSESQRPGFLKKMNVTEGTRVAFMTLAIIGCMRAKAILELRDRYRLSLAPGGGNRITVANIYAFGQEVVDAAIGLDWPWEPIDAMGLDDEGDIDDDAG